MFAQGFFADGFFANGFFVGQSVQPPELPAVERGVGQPASGAYYDTGRGYVRTEHGWVRATKVARCGARAMPVSVGSRATGCMHTFRAAAQSVHIDVAAGVAADIAPTNSGAMAGWSELNVFAGTEVGLVTVETRTQSVAQDTIQFDEILVAIRELL